MDKKERIKKELDSIAESLQTLPDWSDFIIMYTINNILREVSDHRYEYKIDSRTNKTILIDKHND